MKLICAIVNLASSTFKDVDELDSQRLDIILFKGTLHVLYHQGSLADLNRKGLRKCFWNTGRMAHLGIADHSHLDMMGWSLFGVGRRRNGGNVPISNWHAVVEGRGTKTAPSALHWEPHCIN